MSYFAHPHPMIFFEKPPIKTDGHHGAYLSPQMSTLYNFYHTKYVFNFIFQDFLVSLQAVYLLASLTS